jgi:purine-binding chemotaxis protein CheW
MKRVEPRGAIDRGKVHWASSCLPENAAPPPDQPKALLEARARALAAEPRSPRADSVEILEFGLVDEHYAVQTVWVREVLPLRNLTPLPGNPAWVLGIINVRGKIISVLDIKKFFELPEKGLSELDKVIVLGDGTMEFGVLADFIEGIGLIQTDDLQRPLPTLTGIRAEYLMGITRQRAVVLDGGKLLTDPAIVFAEEAQG